MFDSRKVILLGFACLVAVLSGIGFRNALFGEGSGEIHGASLAASIRTLKGEPSERTIEPYEGHGAWVDAFDFVPAYSGPGRLTTDDLDEMVDAGVDTVYLQAARGDDRALGLIVDPPVVARWLVEAHRRDLDVVAWFLPTHADTDRDLDHLVALHDFEVLGHTFDGIALDIESREVENASARSASLVDLAKRYREVAGDEVVGAVVLPAVLLEVVNTDFWPNFPWREIEPAFDVWLPMAYWSDRTVDSGYRNGFKYLDESVRRMRANLDDPDAPVHGIGGIGDAMSDEQVAAFGDALQATEAIGGSIYDWVTLPEPQRQLVDAAVRGEGD